MPRSPTPKLSLSGVIRPRTMFLSVSSTRITRPRTHIGSLRIVASGPAPDRRSLRPRATAPSSGLVRPRVPPWSDIVHDACQLLCSPPMWPDRPRGWHARAWSALSPPSSWRWSCSAWPRWRSAAGARTPRCAPATPCRSSSTGADFDRPDAPWLVAVFTSATCAAAPGCGSGPVTSSAGRGGAGGRGRRPQGPPRPLRDRGRADHRRGRRRGRGARQLPRPGDGHRPLGGGGRAARARQHARAAVPRQRLRVPSGSGRVVAWTSARRPEPSPRPSRACHSPNSSTAERPSWPRATSR